LETQDKQMKRASDRPLLTVAVLLLLVLNLAWIWGNSLESSSVSAQKSEQVTEVIEPVLEVVVGEGNATEHLVRKLAHVTEFACLGANLACLLLVRRRVRWRAVGHALLAALLVALCDESIQIFTDRGAQVSDIWLDAAGAALGLCAVLLVALVCRKRKSADKKNNQ